VSLRLAGVVKRYGEVAAVDGMHLEAADGELLVLLGPSGSGKSTALRLLAGLETPDEGRVEVAGQDVTGVPAHRRDVAMVFQDYALFPHLTVRGNLLFGPRLRGERDAGQAVAAAAERLGLSDLLDRRPDQLSGGQQQRVALARAVLRRPSLFLLDEPLSGLDAPLRAGTRDLLVGLHRDVGATTVLVTHDQVDAAAVADRVAVVTDGRVQQVGAPQDLYDRPATAFVAGFLGGPPMNLVPGGGALGGEPGTVVGARPEDVEVDAAGPVAGVVERVEALGSETVLRVRCGGDLLHVRVPPRAPQRPGDDVRLRVREDRLHVFDAASGARR
jgi:multiple sugar transport system ATP-binding protein